MDEINVKIKLLGNLVWYSSSKEKNNDLQLFGVKSIREVLINQLMVPLEDIALITKNGKPVGLDEKLQNGDSLVVLPVIYGG